MSQQHTDLDAADEEDGAVVCSGLGASPGTTAGTVRIIEDSDEVDAVAADDILVTEMTMPEMVPAMKRAAAIVTDEGGVTCHAAIVSRELGVPAVVGTSDATKVLTNGQMVAVNGERGTISEATDADIEDATTDESETDTTADADDTAQQPTASGSGHRAPTVARPGTTGTNVMVNVSIPEAAQRAAETSADGVGLLRLEHILLSMRKTPAKYVADHGEQAFIDSIADEIVTVAEAFYPRPVRARTLDAPTDELAELEGGEEEPHEHNPMLGWRGIRRSLDEPELTKLELRAFKQVREMGYDNLEMMFPLPNDPEEVVAARELMREVGIDPDEQRWGAMIETPASVRQIDEIIETGIDFAALGTNDLVQYILAVDRNNGNVADRFDEMHPSVLEAMGEVISACNKHDVDTTITGQAGSKPDMARFLVKQGISSVSANVDAVDEVREIIDRAERKMLLEAARSRLTDE